MKNTIFRLLSSTLLIAFIFIKVVDVHSIFHLAEETASSETCEYCELYNTLEQQDIKFTPVNTLSLEVVTHQQDFVYQIFYSPVLHCNSLDPGHFYSLPPPIFS